MQLPTAPYAPGYQRAEAMRLEATCPVLPLYQRAPVRSLSLPCPPKMSRLLSQVVTWPAGWCADEGSCVKCM